MDPKISNKRKSRFKISAQTAATYRVLAILSLIGAGLVLFATARYGLGWTKDGIAYITCARNLVDGAGFVCWWDTQDGLLYSCWPPLYPILLAGFGKIGLEPFDAAGLVSPLIFGCVIFSSGYLFKMFIDRKSLIVLATLFILFSPHLFDHSAFVFSEPLFTLFSILFAISLLKFQQEQRLRFLILASLFAALAFLQRYMGVIIILTGAMVLLSPLVKVPLQQRIKYTAIFSVISLVPCGIWAIRNYILTSALTGGCHAAFTSTHTLFDNIQYTSEVISSWFLYPTDYLPIAIKLAIASALALVFFIAMVASTRHWLRTGVETKFTQAWPIAILVFIYTLGLIVIASVVAFEEISDVRFMLPIYPFVILLFFIGLDNLYSFLLRLWERPKLIRRLVIGFCIVWLALPFLWVSSRTLLYGADGVGWNTTAFRESELTKWVQEHRLEGMIYSNAPEEIYSITGIKAKWSPIRIENGFQEFIEVIHPEDISYLVWYNDWQKGWLYNLDEISAELDIEKIAEYSDGGIYDIQTFQ